MLEHLKPTYLFLYSYSTISSRSDSVHILYFSTLTTDIIGILTIEVAILVGTAVGFAFGTPVLPPPPLPAPPLPAPRPPAPRPPALLLSALAPPGAVNCDDFNVHQPVTICNFGNFYSNGKSGMSAKRLSAAIFDCLR